ncbi:MAG: T9SS type A sorting domain-containing protein [Bacteroidaceae bacterium]|nr:T9SS type A sorting domain-containing protein [Bacteroidaceae bacterium]
MKKTLKLALCSLMLAGAANAQVATLPEGHYDYGHGILPKAFSSDGKAKFLATEELGEDGNIKIHTYNSSFNVEHSFEVIPQKLSDKTITEQRALVVTSGEYVTIDPNKIEHIWEDDYGWEDNHASWSQASQEEKVEWLKFGMDDISDGLFDWDDYNGKDSIYTATNGDVYFYLHGNYAFDEPALSTIVVLSGTTVKYQPITCQRTGEWEVIDTNEDEYENTMTVIWNVINIDNDWSYELSDPLLATQTLFNTDAKYEYIRYKYVAYSDQVSDGRDTDGDGIPDKRTVRSGYDYAGLEVVSEDGNVIASFDVGDIEGRYLILWEGKRYFMLEVYNEGNYEYQIYEINPNGNNITRVSSQAFMHILPAMPKKNTSVTVELGEESVKDGGQLMITDMNGRTVYNNAVAPGETSVQVPLRRMASGVYSVTLMNRGQKIENSKLIIR